MGNVKTTCCGFRPEEKGVRRRLSEEAPAEELVNISGNPTVDDVQLFDEAYEANDIPTFVKLLNSKQPIEELKSQMHPWAAQPKTVGALAATQLAILASREKPPKIAPGGVIEIPPPDSREFVRRAGGIPILVKLLASRADHEAHAALVALSFLSVDSAMNCYEMHKAKALPVLTRHMRGPIDGQRAAAAQTARSIFVLDRKYKMEFIECGGLAALMDLIIPPKSKSEPAYSVLEACYHLEDFILDVSDEIPYFTKYIKDEGIIKRLEAVQPTANDDILEAVNHLLVRLVD
eukprot:Polyplicarium_translucidae@DN2200_c0_g1_i1.p1